MAVEISSALLEQVVAEAAASPDVEICGLLLGTFDTPPLAKTLSKDGSPAVRSGPVLRQAQHERKKWGMIVEEVRPCRNVASDPAHRFEIDPAALIGAYREARAGGPAILGCYHSHPSGGAEPSAHDAAAAASNGWLWLIVAAGETRLWRAVPTGSLHGRFDAVESTE